MSSKSKARLLTTVGGAIAASVAIAPAAQAADTTINAAGTVATVTGHVDIDSILANAGAIGSTASGSFNGVSQTVSPTTATTITVTGNEVTATSFGNNFDNLIDLTTIDNDGLNDGAGSLGSAINDSLGLITAEASGNDIGADLDNFATGSVLVGSNSIDANATGNNGSTTLAGSIPNTYTSTAPGSSSIDNGGIDNLLEAQGSLVASTAQQSGGDVTATAGDNDVGLNLISDQDNTIVAAPAVEDNSVGATAKGNSSNTTIDIQSGDAPTFTGSAVATNGQINSANITATNGDARIVATLDAESTFVNTLAGSLSVDGNTVSSSASGNEALGATAGQAGNRILLADGMSFAGPGASASVDTAYTGGDVSSDVSADLVIHNSQGNTGAGNSTRLNIAATTSASVIGADVQAINGGSISISDNASTATASGNAASSALANGDGAASFAGTAAVANQQTNLYTNVAATNEGAEIGVEVVDFDTGDLPGSTVTVDGNRVAASAYGNQVSQSLSVDGAATSFPALSVDLTGGTGPDGNVLASGNLIVSNLQSQYSSNVSAGESSGIGLITDAEEVTASTLSVTNGTQEAIALGNSASNGLSLSGVGVDTGAGISSVQIVADASAVSASTAADAWIEGYDISGSTVEVSGNLQRAIAYGGSANNSLAISGETVVVDSSVDDVASTVTYDAGAADGFELDFTNAPNVLAAYGLLNVQSVSADITATADGYYEGATGIYVDDVYGGSTIINDGNALVAAAYGTDSTNTASLDAGNLVATSDTIVDEPDFASVLNLTNAQTVTFETSILAQVPGGVGAGTYIDGDLDGSSVSTSDNTVQALAYGNRADNGVIVSATNIDTEADSFPSGIRGSAAVVSNIATTDASFSLNSVQSAGGSITAALVDDTGSPTSSAEIFTVVDLDVTDSSVASNGNTLTAGATANRADNLMDLSGNELATTSALTNFQVSDASLSAVIGVEGTDGTPADPGTPDTPGYTATTNGSGTGYMSTSGDDLIISSGTVTVTFSGYSFTQREVDYLNSLNGVSGASLNGNTVVLSGTVDTTDFNGFSFSSGGDASDTGNETIGLNGFDVPLIPGTSPTPAIPPIPNGGGVMAAIGEDVTSSTISVDGNLTSGSVTGNSAANSLLVEATSAPDGSDHFWTSATADSLGVEAGGDHMLVNSQLAGPSNLDSTVYGTFAINMNDNADISNSTLTVDGNSQSSRAVANTAANSVELDATNSEAGAVLASSQYSEAAVSALSDLDMFAPVSSDNTSVSLSDNSNLAVGVINNATNAVTVSGTNIAPVTFDRDVYLDVDTDMVAFGDHILLNQQSATTAATATAVTSIYNDDGAAIATDGLTNSTVVIAGNSTQAEASANRAVNTMDVSAGSSLGASAGINNAQFSSAVVQSSATTSASVTVAGDTGIAAADSSSVTLGGNTTTALARGNSATNVLNYSAGANYGNATSFGPGAGVSVDNSSANVTVGARAGVLNVQTNSGDGVTATSTNASYLVALNGNTPTVTNATVGVIGNTVAAAAYGNTAANTVTVAALNTGMPTAAVGNVQTNSASVTATVTTVTYGVTSGLGAVAGSALSVTGNSISATAVGNNAVSTIASGM
ncbi:beta strand repeat-containing protein [Croceicoccus estronivorus]|uniref:beta strand repeat-containing protein n=1 Tax=Croceicoccus estronivorus TaxID=1172626 RepID=UPI0009EED030|nr:hypothetical protein [Croceicoccus estronivorus]